MPSQPTRSLSSQLGRVFSRPGNLSPTGATSHPSPLLPGSPLRHEAPPHPQSLPHHAASVPAGHLPSYGHYGAMATSPRAESIPTSPPAAPHPFRRPSGPYHLAMTMPNQPLPQSFGSPDPETPPAYHHVPGHSYHDDHLPHSPVRSRGFGPNSPGLPVTPRSPSFYGNHASTTHRSPAHLAPINEHSHDEAARRHHVTGTVSKFFLSSFEYLQHPHYPIHPAFVDWLNHCGPEVLAVMWRVVSGNVMLPVVVMYEYKSKANVKDFHVGARLEYLHLSSDGHTFSKEYMGDICVREEWQLIIKNKPMLMFAQPLNPKLIPVRGQMFVPKGSDQRYPTLKKPNIQLLSLSFRGDQTDRTRWEVARDDVIEMAEKSGDGDRIGIITSESSVHGWIIQGPKVWEENEKHSGLFKNGFLTHVVLALVIIPLHRPTNMTRLLKWIHQLGPLAAEE